YTVSRHFSYLSSYPYSPQSPNKPESTVFPYTTLFRSSKSARRVARVRESLHTHRRVRWNNPLQRELQRAALLGDLRTDASAAPRSEEHTSELQSRENLVCRLLLEKKKFANEGSASAAD